MHKLFLASINSVRFIFTMQSVANTQDMYGLGCSIPQTTLQDVNADAEIMRAVFLRHREKTYL
jgi:hypothetical protein